jgi:hypothetical protein
MQAQSYLNVPGYLILLTGLILSLISALVPHFEAGYRLTVSVFVAGMLPYLVYGIAVPLMRGAVTTVTGVIIVLVHAWLVINERFVANADYSDARIYYIPVILSIVVLPVVAAAINKSGKY